MEVPDTANSIQISSLGEVKSMHETGDECLLDTGVANGPLKFH